MGMPFEAPPMVEYGPWDRYTSFDRVESDDVSKGRL